MKNFPFFYVGNYIQALWGEAQMEMHHTTIYNGFVEAGIPLLGKIIRNLLI
jgi:hypothetical protein